MRTILRLVRRKLARLRNKPVRHWKLRRARRRVFIDCGANTCAVLRLAIRRYPDFEFFAFEPQPELSAEGPRVIAEHPNTKITFFNKAVWTRNGMVTFYLATRWEENYQAGSTLVEGKIAPVLDLENPVQVEAIDFSEWLGRNFSPEDFVMIKMDIEGAEYDVIEKIVADRHQDRIDEMLVEFHQTMFDTISPERHEALVKAIRGFCYLELWH
jgi:FkbM family methyltransferase